MCRRRELKNERAVMQKIPKRVRTGAPALRNDRTRVCYNLCARATVNARADVKVLHKLMAPIGDQSDSALGSRRAESSEMDKIARRIDRSCLERLARYLN